MFPKEVYVITLKLTWTFTRNLVTMVRNLNGKMSNKHLKPVRNNTMSNHEYRKPIL